MPPSSKPPRTLDASHENPRQPIGRSLESSLPCAFFACYAKCFSHVASSCCVLLLLASVSALAFSPFVPPFTLPPLYFPSNFLVSFRVRCVCAHVCLFSFSKFSLSLSFARACACVTAALRYTVCRITRADAATRRHRAMMRSCKVRATLSDERTRM